MGQLDLKVGGKYRLQRRIGGGSFGAVYIGTDIETDKEVAIKLEHVSIDPSLLEGEFDVYQSLSGGDGIPQVYAYGHDCEYNYMIFDLLGPSLEDLFNFCDRKFSLKTVLLLADQLLSRLEFIHANDVIHRDIKPENFLMGVGKHGSEVYVTDLGLATERRTAKEMAGVARTRNNLIGTARFASVNGHLGFVQHFCDDLESLGYMLVYFLRGSLPWQGLEATDEKEKEELVLEMKQTIKAGDLCKGLPVEFACYFGLIRSLDFDETPDYSHLRKWFNDLFVCSDYEKDDVFDWTILKYLMTLHEEDTVELDSADQTR